MLRHRRRWLPVLVMVGMLVAVGCGGGPAAPVNPAPDGPVRTVRAALLNVLGCPSQSCPVIEDLHAGNKVVLLSPEIKGWYQIRVLASGKEGYVLARFLGQ